MADRASAPAVRRQPFRVAVEPATDRSVWAGLAAPLIAILVAAFLNRGPLVLLLSFAVALLALALLWVATVQRRRWSWAFIIGGAFGGLSALVVGLLTEVFWVHLKEMTSSAANLFLLGSLVVTVVGSPTIMAVASLVCATTFRRREPGPS